MPRAALPISGRVVAITGGARGIGLATARALSARGARVAIGDLDAPAAEREAEALGGAGFALDVTDRAAFGAFLDAAEQRLGPLDVLVNNAGVLHVGPFLEESEAWTRRQIDINVHGVINGMQAALPRMLGRGRGHVVNVGSAASRIGVGREAVYAASKHAVYGLSDSVRQELRGTPVRLSVIMPGLVRTELAAGTTGGRRSRVLAPEDVAAAIAGVIERPRFDVFLPAAYGGLLRVLALLPRSAAEALLRVLGSEAPKQATAADRAEYERRMERLAPVEELSGRSASTTPGSRT